MQGGVFGDVSDIEAGDYFPKKLEKGLSGTDFVIVVMGKKWRSVCDQPGNLRINDPRDFVRREISYALRRIEKDEFVNIIPVLWVSLILIYIDSESPQVRPIMHVTEMDRGAVC